jgi:hypothetical protein
MKTDEELQSEAEKEFDKLQAEGHYELSDLKSKDYWIDGYVHRAMQSRQADVREFPCEHDWRQISINHFPPVMACKKCGEKK